VTIRVTVIVPVYDPPEGALRGLITSLDRQTIGQTNFRAVLVDDGSGPATATLLDRLASSRDYLSVRHEPRFGWPSRPRNIGLDQSESDFVFFADHDDWLGDEALERMVATADRNKSDIVIGKMVGHGRSVPRELFRCSVDDAKLGATPIMTSLTPHKLFRRSFLDLHQLRFPEDVARLEDQIFVVDAYLKAGRISVLSDYACYHHVTRADHQNAAFTIPDPVDYYTAASRVVDLIVESVPPGQLRDRLLARPLRQAIVRRFQGKLFTRLSAADRHAWFDAAMAIIERFPRSIDPLLSYHDQLVTELLRSGDFRGLTRLATWSSSLRLTSSLTCQPDEGSLVVGGEARLQIRRLCPIRWTARSPILASTRRGTLSGAPATPTARLYATSRTGDQVSIPLAVSLSTTGGRVHLSWTGSPTAARLSWADYCSGEWKVQLHVWMAGWHLQTSLPNALSTARAVSLSFSPTLPTPQRA
jgi:glycosyltransferase involved in cell wall biosynthesis